MKPIQKKLEMEFRIDTHKTNAKQQHTQYQATQEEQGTHKQIERHKDYSVISSIVLYLHTFSFVFCLDCVVLLLANYDPSHPHPVRSFKYHCRALPPKTNYCVGVLHSGALHLTPLHAIMPLKPNLAYIDQAQIQNNEEAEKKRQAHRMERKENGLLSEEEMAEMEAEEEEKAAALAKQNELQTVLMKVKKKEHVNSSLMPGSSPSISNLLGGSLRKQSYSFLKQLEDHEKWVEMRLYEQETDKAKQQFNKLLATNQTNTHRNTQIQFNVPAHEYLQYVNPFDMMEASNNGPSMCAAGDENRPLQERLLHLLRISRIISFRDLCLKLSLRNTSLLDLCLIDVSLMCWVIQGNLVLKSSIVYDRAWKTGNTIKQTGQQVEHTATHSMSRRDDISAQDRAEYAREYLLTLFHRHRVLNRSSLMPVLKLDLEQFDEILNELARPIHAIINGQQTHGVMWEFRLTTDHTFINK